LNIEGWRASVEQQFHTLEFDAQAETSGASFAHEASKATISAEERRSAAMENMREAAHSIYEEYLSDKASPKLHLDDSAVKRLLFKIRTEPPNAEWFTEVQNAVFEKLQVRMLCLKESDKKCLISRMLSPNSNLE
jgi:hypothetical protein